MHRNGDAVAASYAEALAAFKRDSHENAVIARLLHEHFHDALVAPVLDVGAGSGELAALAFPDRLAILLDLDEYDPPTNPLDHRIRGDFLDLDLSPIRPRTIVFCHSLNILACDPDRLNKQLRESGAQSAIVVSNENAGALKQVTDKLAAAGMPGAPTFHVPVPRANLEKKIPFSVLIKSADFPVLSRHFVRILLDCDTSDAMLSALERLLRLCTEVPQVEIAEAIYCYRLYEA
jgi:hypothetical protein